MARSGYVGVKTLSAGARRFFLLLQHVELTRSFNTILESRDLSVKMGADTCLPSNRFANLLSHAGNSCIP